MQLAIRIVATLAVLAGGLFFLQGIGVIPGSYMTGRGEWAVIGGALVAGGVAMVWLGALASRREP